jgi:beta-galactosidase
MVAYWHWHTLHYGGETYWGGVLGHDLQPNRVYREFTTTAKELKKVGSKLLNLKKDNKVAILYSHDSFYALSFMLYAKKIQYPAWELVHLALYNQNIETDIVPCDLTSDFSKYKMLVIPPLYVASDELLNKIDKYVKDGGHVVMMLKSGYCNEHSAARATTAPGPLRKACGFYYQEYSSIPDLALKGNPFELKDATPISEWYEFLVPETAKPLAYADHPFFGQWPVITENAYGKGKLTYIGTYPSAELLEKIVRQVATQAGVLTPQNDYRFPIVFRSGKNQLGKQLHYIFNFSGENKEVNYPFPAGKELISGRAVNKSEALTLKAWDVVIIEE